MTDRFGSWSNQPDIYVLLGYPLTMTLSPAMHNKAFKEMGLDAVYLPLRVAPGDIELAVKAMRRFGWRGANVTIPHKLSIMRYLDHLSPEAQAVGAVNTVVNENGRLIGCNTDIQGFADSFPLNPVELGMITVLGAGGAARAVVFALLRAGAKKITVLNRTVERAEQLAADLGAHFPGVELMVHTLDDDNWQYLSEAEAIVNCTPVDFPFPLGWQDRPLFSCCRCAYDLRYQHEHNKFLALAAAHGVPLVLDGREMLLGQAALAFRLWTGREAPVETMRMVLY